jgi:hypothetical protein
VADTFRSIQKEISPKPPCDFKMQTCPELAATYTEKLHYGPYDGIQNYMVRACVLREGVDRCLAYVRDSTKPCYCTSIKANGVSCPFLDCSIAW